MFMPSSFELYLDGVFERLGVGDLDRGWGDLEGVYVANFLDLSIFYYEINNHC